MEMFFSNMDPKMKKLVQILIIIVVVFILFIVGVQVYHLIFGTKVSYSKLEGIIENAGIRYFATDNRLPQNEGESKMVDTTTLSSEKYMRTFDKYTNDTGCLGNVTVTYNGGQYLYTTNLNCNDYKTVTLSSKIMSTLVESGDGLYLKDNEYYYRGEYVNNYIKLNGEVYRILSIDTNGNIKIIDFNPGVAGYPWDDRFNQDANQSFGINDFDKSRIKETLNKNYDSLSNGLKKYIINYDWCIGKRDSNDSIINSIPECANTYKQFLGLFIPSDYIRVSLDEKCTNLFDGSCKNYNYFKNEIKGSNTYWTLTPVSDNSYQVFSLSAGGEIINDTKALSYNRALNTFYINGNNVYISGIGSINDPYTIK